MMPPPPTDMLVRFGIALIVSSLLYAGYMEIKKRKAKKDFKSSVVNGESI